MNQKSDHGFTCICPSCYTGANCEISIDSSAERELNMDLCVNGGICLGESGHTFYCRSVFIYSQLTKYIFSETYKYPSSNPLQRY